MPETASIPETLPLDSPGRVDADIFCRGCGYNLRLVAGQRRLPRECNAQTFRPKRIDLWRLNALDGVASSSDRGLMIIVGAVIGIIQMPFFTGSVVIRPAPFSTCT